jgi:hypothetical protein
MLRSFAKMILVGIAHFAIGVSLYHQRISHPSSFLDSDVVVFFLPAFLAFVGYFMAAWFCGFLPQRRATKIALAIPTAVLATAISSMCTMAFAFNKWGS